MSKHGMFSLHYDVFRADPERLVTALPPVILAIQGRGFSLQDYLTADEADRLADALKAEAARAREAAS